MFVLYTKKLYTSIWLPVSDIYNNNNKNDTTNVQ